MMSLRRAATALACLPLIVLAACGDDDSEADEPSTPTASASPSATPSPTESETPEPDPTAYPADEFTADEFVEAWVEAYDQATFFGDTHLMRTMSSDQCLTCESLIQSLEGIEENGGFIDVNDEPTVINVLEVDAPESSGAATQVTVELAFPGGTTRETSDSEVIEFGPVVETWDFYLSAREGDWTVTEIGL